tara:strand:- start:899 stop:1339 length:441 start_codon:yes stop_codon:yes gene_type:complete
MEDKKFRKPYNTFGVLEQVFEYGRGECIAIQTDSSGLNVKFKVITSELQIYTCYYQTSNNNDKILLEDSHIISDYDFGFQFSNNEYLWNWDGPVLRHHLLFNIKKTKEWSKYYKDTVIDLPLNVFPNLKKTRIPKELCNLLETPRV